MTSLTWKMKQTIPYKGMEGVFGLLFTLCLYNSAVNTPTHICVIRICTSTLYKHRVYNSAPQWSIRGCMCNGVLIKKTQANTTWTDLILKCMLIVLYNLIALLFVLYIILHIVVWFSFFDRNGCQRMNKCTGLHSCLSVSLPTCPLRKKPQSFHLFILSGTYFTLSYTS